MRSLSTLRANVALWIVLVLALLAVNGKPGWASVIDWTIDFQPSQLTISGHGVATGFGNTVLPLSQQGVGALETHYTGSISSIVQEGITPTIQILSANAVAANNGTWAPTATLTAGSAPANYATTTSVSGSTSNGAIRDLSLSIGTSGARALSSNPFLGPGTASFSDSSASASALSGRIDTLGTGLLANFNGAPSLAGLTATTASISGGTITNDGTTLTMDLPITMNFNSPVYGVGTPSTLDDVTFVGQLTGTLVAHAHFDAQPVSVVPEPDTIIIWSVLALAAVGVRWLHRTKIAA